LMVLTFVRLETKIFPVTLTDDMLLMLTELMTLGPTPTAFRNPPPVRFNGPALMATPPPVIAIPPFVKVSPPLIKTVEANMVEGVEPVTPLWGG